MKTCTICKIEKPLCDFHRQRKSNDGRRNQCKACRIASSKRYYEKNAARIQENTAKYKKEHQYAYKIYNEKYQNKHRVKVAFFRQRSTAKARGVDFNLTLEQFRDFWGDNFDNRGRNAQSLVCARYADEGAYEVGNIYICTVAENSSAPRKHPPISITHRKI